MSHISAALEVTVKQHVPRDTRNARYPSVCSILIFVSI